MSSQLVPDSPDRLKCRERSRAVRRNRHGEPVDDDILARNSVLFRGVINLPCDPDSSFRCPGNSILIDTKADKNTAVFLHERHNFLDLFPLAVHGIDHCLAVVVTERRLERISVRRVDLKRKCADSLQLQDDLAHHLRFIDLRQSDIHIQNICTGIFLLKSL